ncbi:hypothetical protein WG66_006203 [Moniliophthora roreri]|nr:hypothetical protein WG66_006203 [Moniliophthora roreri]
MPDYMMRNNYELSEKTNLRGIRCSLSTPLWAQASILRNRSVIRSKRNLGLESWKVENIGAAEEDKTLESAPVFLLQLCKFVGMLEFTAPPLHSDRDEKNMSFLARDFWKEAEIGINVLCGGLMHLTGARTSRVTFRNEVSTAFMCMVHSGPRAVTKDPRLYPEMSEEDPDENWEKF